LIDIIVNTFSLNIIFKCYRSELGKISLDKVFRERENLNYAIVESLNKASASWGLVCFRYEIRKDYHIFFNNDIDILMIFYLGDIKLPNRVQEAMQMQVEAERKKRAAILDSEGIREAEINVAEGKRQSTILASGELLKFIDLWSII
jgi:regulator of protease activity HflC (stomatin/prohibitin superfamily)